MFIGSFTRSYYTNSKVSFHPLELSAMADISTSENNANYTLNATVNANIQVPVWITHRNGLTAWFGVMLSFAVVGTFLNLILIYVILSSRKLRHGSGILILNCLFINFVLCGIDMPILIVDTYFGEYYQYAPDHFCKHLVLFYYSFVYTVDWAQLAVGVNRFVAIFFPHAYRTWTHLQVIVPMLVIPYVIPFSCNLVMFYDIGATYQATKPWGACGVKPFPHSSVYTIVVALCVALPVAALGMLYATIFLAVWTRSLLSQRQIDSVGNPAVHNSNQGPLFRRRYRSVKMLFLTAVWYSMALLPAPITSSFFSAQYNSQPMLQLVFRGFLLAAYATSPLIYLAKTEDYRRRISHMWMNFRISCCRYSQSSEIKLKSTSFSGKPSQGPISALHTDSVL